MNKKKYNNYFDRKKKARQVRQKEKKMGQKYSSIVHETCEEPVKVIDVMIVNNEACKIMKFGGDDVRVLRFFLKLEDEPDNGFQIGGWIDSLVQPIKYNRRERIVVVDTAKYAQKFEEIKKNMKGTLVLESSSASLGVPTYFRELVLDDFEEKKKNKIEGDIENISFVY